MTVCPCSPKGSSRYCNAMALRTDLARTPSQQNLSRDFVGRSLKPSVTLGAAATLATIAVLPSLMVLQAEPFIQIPPPLPALFLAQTVQSILVFSFLSFIGFRDAESLNLKAPVKTGGRGQTPPAKLPVKTLALSLYGVFVLALGVAALEPLFGLPMAGVPKEVIWKAVQAPMPALQLVRTKTGARQRPLERTRRAE